MKKKSKNQLVFKSVVLLLTLFVMIFIGSLSWYSNNKVVTADGVNVKSKAPDGLEIAVVPHGAYAPGDSEYKKGEIFLNKDNCKFLEELHFTEITGNGEQDKFYKPLLTQASGLATPDLNAEWDKAQENIHFLSFDLYMRSKSSYKVYLDSTTSVSPVSSVLKWDEGFDADAYNPSLGNFSRDCIVGATRVSFVKDSYYNQPGKLQFLWLPAANIRYDSSTNTVQTDFISIGIIKQMYRLKKKNLLLMLSQTQVNFILWGVESLLAILNLKPQVVSIM